jgi:membrane protein required for colicin V production
MGIINTIILILLGLLLFFGLYKGFIKQVFSIGAWFLAILVPFLFSKPVTSLIGESKDNSAFGTRSLVFVGLFILTFLIVKIIGHKIGNTIQKGALGWIDRFLGGLWGAAKGLIIVSLALLLIKGIVSIPFIGTPVLEFITSDLKLGSSEFGIGKYLYENNLLLKLIKVLM